MSMQIELGPVEHSFHQAARDGRKLFLVLVDPDRIESDSLSTLAEEAARAGVDGFLAGTSLLLSDGIGSMVKRLREESGLPVILFPGDTGQVVAEASAILFLSLISGRNPQFLIGEQVKGAPQVFRAGLECLPTAYVLVESGLATSAQFMSASQPLPRHKPDIAVAHALAARCLGLRQLYLEAGSGAPHRVPDEMIRAVKDVYPWPVIVGGGLRQPEDASRAARAGADVVVVGTAVEDGSARGRLGEFVKAVHGESRHA
jgi:phosphoglycerol geranylgeranyltransferase